MHEYHQILDESSLNQFWLDLEKMTILLISASPLLKIPRSPPGPQYIAKEANQSTTKAQSAKYLVLVNQEKNIEKWNDALFLLQKLTKPETIENDGSGDEVNQNLYLSEDDIVQRHVTQVQKKYIDFLKETESEYKHLIKD